jgi:hypothetical protein
MWMRCLIQRSAHAAALLAVALLGLASTQSIVMQAAEAAPGPAMAACAGMAMTQPNAKHGVPADKTRKTCPICAAAAHAPVCGSVVSIPRSSAVAWMTYGALQPLGPRGPPAFAPKARGPPQIALTI